jgi:hypothetical protein
MALAPDLTRLRLWTGFVLFLFAATHLANHALGLISLEAMEAGRGVFVGFWRTPPAELALLLSFLLHAGSPSGSCGNVARCACRRPSCCSSSSGS